MSDLAADGVALDVEFSTAYPNAGLTFRSNAPARMPVLLLKNDLTFASIIMPAATGGIINLKPGIYDAAALEAAGVASECFENHGGQLTVH